MTPVAPARLAAWAGSLVRTRSRGEARVGEDVAGLLAIAVIAIATLALCVAIYITRASAPISGDGIVIQADFLPVTLGSALRPFRQHLDTIPILIWGALASSSQLLAVLLTTHLALAVGTAAFLVRRLGAFAGFALALPLALLGSAHYNLLMPWQIVFTIPLLCGLVATWASLPRRRTSPRRAAVAIAMLVAVLTSDVGLFLVVALGIWFALDGRRRQTWELVPAAMLWAAWFVTFGLSGLNSDGTFYAIPSQIAPFTLLALTSGLGGLVGLDRVAGALILAALVGWVLVRRIRIPPAVVGFIVSLVVLFALASLFRASGTRIEEAAHNRYIYLVGYFIAFGIGAAAPRLTIPAGVLVAASLLAATLNVIALMVALPAYP